MVSDAPTAIFFALIALLAIIELLFLALVFYLRWQQRRRYRFAVDDPFEERQIVVPPPEPVPPTRPSARGRRPTATDPTGAYLAALDELARDGRWPRRETETPAAHAARAGREGFDGTPLARLSAAYQLARYGARPLGRSETRRARPS